MITLYELAAADPNLRFSPFCWRTRMALAHKGLEVDGKPWRFTETQTLAPSGQGRVPVIVDRGKWIADSPVIAGYLEETYPDRPSLFGGGAGRALSRFYADWTETVLQPGVVRLILMDIYGVIAEQHRPYFRESREARFGMKLEQVVEGRAERLPALRQSLAPLRATVTAQPFLGGDKPLYPDYIVFGAFQFARVVSDFELLEKDDPVAAWRGRMLDLHGGLGRRAAARAA